MKKHYFQITFVTTLYITCLLTLSACGAAIKEGGPKPPALSATESPAPMIMVAPQKTDNNAWVLFEFEISDKGRVVNPVATSAYPAKKSYISDAKQAFKKWRYHPKLATKDSTQKTYKAIVKF